MAYPFTQPAPQYGMANQVNAFMAQQVRQPYQFNLPLYGQLTMGSSRNIRDWQRGIVPGDVTNLIQQQGAERGIATGMPGAQSANASWLRALGLTSLGLQQQAEGALNQAVQRTPVPEVWNPMSLYVPERTAYSELQAAMPQTTWSGTQSSPWGGFSELQNRQATGKWW